MNHIVFPCRQFGPAGVMLLRIPSSQNFFWKMALPSWVSLSDVLFLFFCFSLSFWSIFPLSILLLFCLTRTRLLFFITYWAFVFHQSVTLRVTFFFIFFFSYHYHFLHFVSWLCFLSLGSFLWDMEEALLSRTLAFKNFVINHKKTCGERTYFYVEKMIEYLGYPGSVPLNMNQYLHI